MTKGVTRCDKISVPLIEIGKSFIYMNVRRKTGIFPIGCRALPGDKKAPVQSRTGAYNKMAGLYASSAGAPSSL